MNAATTLLALVLAQVAPSTLENGRGEKPGSLLLFESARAQITGDLSIRSYAPGQNASLFRATINRRGEMIFHLDGRTDGVTAELPDGQPLYRSEQTHLLTHGAVWERYQRRANGSVHVAASASQKRVGILDFRTVGMLPGGPTLLSTPENVFGNVLPENIEYSERPDDQGNQIVEVRLPEDQMIRFWLSQEVGGNALRVEELRGGQVVSAVETEYACVNNVWLPVRSVKLNQAGEVRHVTEIEYARVGSPELDRPLTPVDAGFLPGAPISHHDGETVRQLTWTGTDAIPTMEYIERERRGEVQRDPWVVARLAERKLTPDWREKAERERRTPPPDVRTPDKSELQRILRERAAMATRERPDHWERYVRGFIADYALDSDQEQKCLAILADCKERRAQYLNSRREQLDRLRHPSGATEGDLKIQIEQIAQLMKPVDKIFADLQRRLEPVPTRAQRAQVANRAAESTAASAPAKR